MTGVLYRKEEINTKTQREVSHMKRDGSREDYAAANQEMPGTIRSRKRRERILP